MKRLGVTGASGYLGCAVVSAARQRGVEVVALGRRGVPGCREWRALNLVQPPHAALLDGLDAVIHLAAYTGQGDVVAAEQETAFAFELARLAQGRGIPCVIASSQAAAPDAPSAYGRTKAAIEAATRPLDAVLLRPGMVVGGREYGLFGLLCDLVRRSPLLPWLLPAPSVQPVHVDDVASAFLAACARPDLAGEVIAVAGEPMPFHSLLAGISRERVRRRCLWLPVPVVLLRLSLAQASQVTGARMSPARLDSLVSLPPLDPSDAARRLGVTLRPAAAALDRRGREIRAFLIEARALSLALLGPPPPPRMLRRYVQLLRRQGVEAPLGLDPTLLARPRWLAALDEPGSRTGATRGSLAWRFGAMVRLAEAEPVFASRFIALPGAAGRMRVLRDIIAAGSVELSMRLLAPLARRRWQAKP